VAAGIIFWPNETRAVTSWNTDASGTYSDPNNWTSGVPTTGDTAIFNRGAGATYSVNFPGAFQPPSPVDSVGSLEIGSNDVTFQRSVGGLFGASFQSLNSMFIGYTTGVATTFTTTLPVTAQTAEIASGTNSVAGVHINSGKWTLTGSSLSDRILDVGEQGVGTLSITNGAQLELTGMTANVVVGDKSGAGGGLLVSGTGSQLVIDGNGDMEIGNFGSAQLTITAGGKITQTGDSGPRMSFTAAYVVPGSTASVDGAGSSWTMLGSIIVYGTLSVFNGGATSDVAVSGGGTFSGDGTIHRLDNANGGGVDNGSPDSVAPGFPIGALHVGGGGFHQGSLGHLQVEIGGTTAGTQFDQLLVSGSVTAGGALDVSFVNGFLPHLGESFKILDFTSFSGNFAAINLPAIASDLMWSTWRIHIDGTLLVTVPGDYNGDGTVDAADYTIWHDSLGQMGSGLAADGNGNGVVDQGDYNVWKMHFGGHIGSGAASNAEVPEPAAWLLLVVGMISIRLALPCAFSNAKRVAPRALPSPFSNSSKGPSYAALPST
jgi:T5SS/PEP-CTERM-associated repeat protein